MGMVDMEVNIKLFLIFLGTNFTLEKHCCMINKNCMCQLKVWSISSCLALGYFLTT